MEQNASDLPQHWLVFEVNVIARWAPLFKRTLGKTAWIGCWFEVNGDNDKPDQEATEAGARHQESPSHLARSCDPPQICIFIVIVCNKNLVVSFENNPAQGLNSFFGFRQIPGVIRFKRSPDPDLRIKINFESTPCQTKLTQWVDKKNCHGVFLCGAYSRVSLWRPESIRRCYILDQ